MAEQKCIICGNIVRFNAGERFATCEYCETKQEYRGEDIKAEAEEIRQTVTPSGSPLERAGNFDTNGNNEQGRILPVRPAYMGDTVNTAPPMGYGVADVPKTAPTGYYPPPPPPPKKSIAGRVVAIVFGSLLMLILTVVFLVAIINRDTAITYANATINTPEVGRYVWEISPVPDDASQYWVSLEECYYYDSDSGEYVYLSSDDRIEEECEYTIVLKFYPEDGYVFDYNTDVRVNGETVFFSDEVECEVHMNAVDLSKETIQIGHKFTNERVSVGGFDSHVLELDETATNCIEFTTNFQVTQCTRGTVNRTWNIYIRTMDGDYESVNSFYYSGSGLVTHTTSFDEPTSFDAVIILPQESNIDINWSYKMSVEDFVIKKNY